MERDETRQARIEAGARAIHAEDCALWGFSESWDEAEGKHIYRAKAEACLDVAAPAVGVTVEEAGKLISDLVNTWDRIPKSVLDPEYERKWIAYLDVRDRMMDALLTAHPEPGSTTAGDW